MHPATKKSSALLKELLTLEVLLHLTMRHNTAVLGATILVNIDHTNRRLHLLLVRLDILLPLNLAIASLGALPEHRVLPERRILLIALLDAPLDVVAVAVRVGITRCSLFETRLAGLRLGVVDVHDEGLLLGLVVLGAAGYGCGAGFEG
jgi:hypothetical protein